MTTELDTFPIADLQERYKIGRTQVYSRLEAMNIKPEKLGSRSFINADQLVLMDSLNEHLKNGGAIADFAKQAANPEPQKTFTAQKENSTEQTEQVGQLAVTSPQSALVAKRSPQLELDVAKTFENLELLDKVVERRWHLSSSQVKVLLRLASLPKSPFSRYGFQFDRVGKNGIEAAWKITKGE